VPFAVNAGGLGWLKPKAAARIKDRVDYSLTFSGKTRVAKKEIICQGFSRFLVAGISQGDRQNIVRSI